MSSLYFPMVANIYMDYFEGTALKLPYSVVVLWYRYVNDYCTKLKHDQIQPTLDHLPLVNSHIKFTNETRSTDGGILFQHHEF